MTNTFPHDAPPHTLIRHALLEDADSILRLVEALAAYEKLPPPDEGAKGRLVRDLFSPEPRIEAFLAEYGGEAVGYAFILETYSSFLALPTLFLEDLFVLPSHRHMRVGLSLFSAAVAEAHRRGCGRMEWTVLDWNSLAIDFYKKLGATHMKEWQLYRLLRPDMEAIMRLQL